MEKDPEAIYLRWVGGASEKQLKKENNMYGCIYLHFVNESKYDTVTFYPNRSKSFEDQVQEYSDKFKVLTSKNYHFYIPQDKIPRNFSEVFPIPNVQPIVQTTLDRNSDVTPVDAVKEAIVRINKI